MIWLTSDCHFNHLNILKYESETRNFQTLQEHNEAIIRNWNSVVAEDDDIWVCGDFFLGDPALIPDILNRLKGHIHLVRGNHDSSAKLDIYAAHGIDIHDIAYLQYHGVTFILNHFPPIISEEFTQMLFGDKHKIVYCYGHVHGVAPKGYYHGTFHVGVDTNNLMPVSLDDILRDREKHLSAF